MNRDQEPPDSARYPLATDTNKDSDIPGYPAAPRDPDIPGYRRACEEVDGADIRRYPSRDFDERPLYQDSGFDSLEEYLDYVDDLWRRKNGLPPYPADDVRVVAPRDGLGSRQVGLRLPEADYRLLCEVGDEYGLPPATMARTIVVRALRTRRGVRSD